MYSTKEIAKKLGVSYDHFRHNRELYEKYMCNFFDYKIIARGNITI